MTNTAAPSSVQSVKDAIRKFEAAQAKYRSHGAQDTEPDGIFQSIIWRVINDKEVSIPKTGDGWELYASSMDCTEAARALEEATRDVLREIQNCPMSESKELRKYISDYCWRCN